MLPDSAALFESLSAEQWRAPRAELESTFKRDLEQPMLSSTPSESSATSSVPPHRGLGPVAPPSMDSVESLSVGQQLELMAKLAACLPRDMEKPLCTHRPGPGLPPPPSSICPALPPPQSFIQSLSAEQRRVLIAKLEAGLPHDMVKLREKAQQHLSTVAEALEKSRTQARAQDQPRTACVPNTGAFGPHCTRRPGPAVPPPLSFIEGLSAEQRRALRANLEAGLPHDIDRLLREASEQGRMVAKTPERTLTTCVPNRGAHEAQHRRGLGTAVPPPLKLIQSLPAEQRRALMDKLEAGLLCDVDKLREGAERQLSVVVETPKQSPTQATTQDWPQAARGPNLGARALLHTKGPGPAMPPPLGFVEGLSAEQRRALIAQLESRLPLDMDRLRVLGAIPPR